MSTLPEKRATLPLKDAARESFLAELAKTGSIVRASDNARIRMDDVDLLKRSDPSFESELELAKARFRAHLEEECLFRAVHGHKEPIVDRNGVQVVDGEGNLAWRVKKSDKMLELLLKRHCPEYRETMKVDHNLTGGVLVVGARAKDVQEWQDRHTGGNE